MFPEGLVQTLIQVQSFTDLMQEHEPDFRLITTRSTVHQKNPRNSGSGTIDFFTSTQNKYCLA